MSDLNSFILSQQNTIQALDSLFTKYNAVRGGALSKSLFKLRIEGLQSHWKKFIDNHNDIVIIAEGDDLKLPYFNKNTFSETEEKFIQYCATIQEDMMIRFPAVPIPVPEIIMAAQPNHNLPRLPPILIPKFSGDYSLWPAFFDLFNTLVHRNAQIDDVQKLHHLKTLLSGEAADLIAPVQCIAANYNSAYETLTDRYNNRRCLVGAQLSALLLQPSIQGESSTAIKHLLDTTARCLMSLQNLNINTDSWFPFIVHITINKLPVESQQLWEQHFADRNDIPTLDEMKVFLKARFRTLERTGDHEYSRQNPGKKSQSSTRSENKSFHVSNSNQPPSCPICLTDHSIRKCQKFAAMNVLQRKGTVSTHRLCMNCLSNSHLVSNCLSKMNCRHCNHRHHSFLHDEAHGKNKNTLRFQQPFKKANPFSTQIVSPIAPPVVPPIALPNVPQCCPHQQHTSPPTQQLQSHTMSSHFASNNPQNRHILLATAKIIVHTNDGQHHILRVLLDQGSQCSFIIESAVQRLRLQRERFAVSISGVGSTPSNKCNSRVVLNIASSYEDFSLRVQAIVIRSITGFLPNQFITRQEWPHIKDLQLADPGFDTPANIDMLLGADVYAKIIRDGVRSGPSTTPLAQQTALGWILSGEISSSAAASDPRPTVSLHQRVDQILQQFWEIEDIKDAKKMSLEEQKCESHFLETYSRSTEGRFMVKLPFRLQESGSTGLGKSRDIAVARLLSLERRFLKDPILHRRYSDCLNEYINAGHMEVVNSTEEDHRVYNADTKTWWYTSAYLPHHCVIKEDSSTTKLRVVFDASRQTTSGISLNDTQMVGPTIQQDLVAILIRWRKQKIAFTADIKAMYRQVRVTPTDSDFLRIVWRESPELPITDYRLLTVTFGTSSAPYLAVKTLQQLAKIEEKSFPSAATVAKTDFYVDDVLTGSDSIEDAITLHYQLISMLALGGFQLRKWSSNCPELLDKIPPEFRELNPVNLKIDESIKALGISWHPTTDHLAFKIQIQSSDHELTKRDFLSQIASFFDPLGLISPVIIIPKIIFQKLWLAKTDWDELLPKDVNDEWHKIRQDLHMLSTIKVPRWIHHGTGDFVQLHGFADASERAYAAVIYTRTVDSNGKIHIHLVASKTRVAPIKTLTIPRLELCGVLLLAKLMAQVSEAMSFPTVSKYGWTDSTVVLGWLKKHPGQLTTFVANRVSQILEIESDMTWNHVSTYDNPADCASRGMRPQELMAHETWWKGPNWLSKESEFWPKPKSTSSTIELPEIKKVFTVTVESDLLLRYSCIHKLLRITAYCLRILHRFRKHRIPSTQVISSAELLIAEHKWILRVQEAHFLSELRALMKSEPISPKSKLLCLNPFRDSHGMLRIGGRLQNANIPYQQKHPIILPKHSHFTHMLIDQAHKDTMHGGVQLMMAQIRQKYWILDSRNVIRHQIYKCLKCVRLKAQVRDQLMGSLPAARISASRPFLHTGVDFTGAIDLRNRGRGRTTYKGYICIFVCLATRAVHLEAVSDLSKEGFIASFRRFTSRRGRVSDMYSDCGTNFIGGNRILAEDVEKSGKNLGPELTRLLAIEGLTWHFNPPGSPHFGGIWESGVKSVKYHFRRVIGDTVLTYEELATTLAQIECCLNSRPLYPMTSDPNDLTALTPGHFLIGEATNNFPEPNLLDKRLHLIKRWYLVQKIQQDFWKRWNADYISSLQNRVKWTKAQPNFKINDMVLVKDERMPPSKWLLGRVVELHPGADNLIRVVSIRVQNGILKRNITKLCYLPTHEKEQIKLN